MASVRTSVVGFVGGPPVTSHRGPTPASGAGPCEMDNQGAGYSERRSLRAKERGDGVDPSQEQVDPHASVASADRALGFGPRCRGFESLQGH